mmetsp:Transcript_8111/g.14217  ORF Transcript_8111/g.14217 Transcript_8111/m.14217 type:complete len:331 (-) Transcript_8111:53-1045(-)
MTTTQDSRHAERRWRCSIGILISIITALFHKSITMNRRYAPINMTTPKAKDDENAISPTNARNHTQIFLRQSDPVPPPTNGTVRLVFLSDTHGHHDKIPLPLPDGDILLHLGDASDRGNLTETRSFVKWMKKHSFHKERIVIDGNHDRDIFLRPGQSRRDFMAEYEGVARVLRDEVVEVADGKMAIAGVTWDACESQNFTMASYNIHTWSVSTNTNNDEIKKVDLILSHLPPHVKGGGRGWHGSEVLSQFVKDINPPLHCFGHIHYARGVRASNSSTMMVNCATTWHEPIVVDYCPVQKRALMIHCPVPEESLMEHLRSRQFPIESFMQA